MFAYIIINCNFTPTNKTNMKEYSLLVWYRYVSFGEEEKDFDLFTVEALGIHDAFKKIKKIHFQGNSRIPTSYAINVKPYQWYKARWLVSCVRNEDTNKPFS